jgi:HPt (histidine-containing phosphotransfer) domain-containing protein
VVQLYLDDSVVKLDKLTTALAAETPPVADIDGVVHQFKGSSASLGAARVAAACVSFRTAAKASDVEGMKTWLAAMRAEFTQARGAVLPRCVCRALTASDAHAFARVSHRSRFPRACIGVCDRTARRCAPRWRSCRILTSS